jgi:hypothetical protein
MQLIINLQQLILARLLKQIKYQYPVNTIIVILKLFYGITEAGIY